METVSKVTIVSSALVRLGEVSISSFTEKTKIDPLANLYYVQRDALLRSHPWNCAVKRKILAAKVAPAIPEQVDYANTFALPSDFLRLLSVGNYGEEPDYKIEGREILCDETALRIRYIYRNEDESTWDTMLIEAMQLAMIAAMAYAVTQSTSKEQAAYAALSTYLKMARAVDGQEDPPEFVGDHFLLNSRFGSYYAQR